MVFSNTLGLSKRYPVILFYLILSTLLIKTDLISEFFTEKDAYMAFNLSMMTQVEEDERQLRMNFAEFVEVLARLAEKLSPVPIGEHYDKWSLPTK
jgi:hypothetical protein